MEKFKECKICKNVYNYQCGEFLEHIIQEHKLNREQYIVLIEYGNVHPKCQCGYCDDNAQFIPRKNMFHKINSEHRSFKWIENKYIEKYGEPKCKACGNKVRFHRGKPNTYCSLSCKPSSWNQEQVNKTVKERYGVKNVMDIESIKKKASKKSKYFWEKNKKECVQKIKKTKMDRYGDENYCNTEKAKKTIFEHYGVDSYFKTKKGRDMCSKTAIKTNSKNSTIIKQFKKTEIYYQGTYEYRFLEYCENKGVLYLVQRAKSSYWSYAYIMGWLCCRSVDKTRCA